MNPTWNDLMVFNLSNNPTIFDIGGYKGEWTEIARKKYPDAKIYVFEPVLKFYEEICSKYYNDSNIMIFNFGLSDETREENISLLNDGSSVYVNGGKTEKIKLKNITEFLFENKIFRVDLAKVNIEGEEYRLFENLIDIPELNIFENFIVQFHPYVQDYEQRRIKILSKISKYYDRIVNYEMIFECWKRREIEDILCLGDSHVSSFSFSDTIIDIGNLINFENFFIYRFGPWLAYNLPGRIDEIKQVCNSFEEKNILFNFGEIDCRAQVKKICELTNRPSDEVIKEIVEKLFIVIDLIKAKQKIVFSVAPEIVEKPHNYYYKDNPEVFDCPRGTMDERKKYKEKFHLFVEEECKKRSIIFLDIYSIIEKKENKSIYFLDDIHLKPKNVNYLIKYQLLNNDFAKNKKSFGWN